MLRWSVSEHTVLVLVRNIYRKVPSDRPYSNFYVSDVWTVSMRYVGALTFAATMYPPPGVFYRSSTEEGRVL